MNRRGNTQRSLETILTGTLLLSLAFAVRLYRTSVTPMGEEEFLVLNQPRETGLIDYL